MILKQLELFCKQFKDEANFKKEYCQIYISKRILDITRDRFR